jgi:hypothetical protein
MPTKYKKRTLRTKSKKLNKSKKSKKIKGGRLSARTIELLRNQYQGINRDRMDRPTNRELNQFMIDNNIPFMQNISHDSYTIFFRRVIR